MTSASLRWSTRSTRSNMSNMSNMSPMSTCFTQEGINIWCCYICAVSVSCLHALRTIGRCFFIWNQSNASTSKDFLAYRKNRTGKKKTPFNPSLHSKTMTKVPVRLALWAECADATAHLCASMTINAQCSFSPATYIFGFTRVPETMISPTHIPDPKWIRQLD